MIARTQLGMDAHMLQQEAERLLSPYTDMLGSVVKKLAEREPSAPMMSSEDFGHNIRGRAAALAQGARLAKAGEHNHCGCCVALSVKGLPYRQCQIAPGGNPEAHIGVDQNTNANDHSPLFTRRISLLFAVNESYYLRK